MRVGDYVKIADGEETIGYAKIIGIGKRAVRVDNGYGLFARETMTAMRKNDNSRIVLHNEFTQEDEQAVEKMKREDEEYEDRYCKRKFVYDFFSRHSVVCLSDKQISDIYDVLRGVDIEIIDKKLDRLTNMVEQLLNK